MAKSTSVMNTFLIVAFLVDSFLLITALQGKQYPKRLKLPQRSLQQQNFHEPNRWTPPVRYIPLDVARFNVYPQEEEEDSTSGSGSGFDAKPACDDEDGDCDNSSNIVHAEAGVNMSSLVTVSSIPPAASMSMDTKLSTVPRRLPNSATRSPNSATRSPNSATRSPNLATRSPNSVSWSPSSASPSHNSAKRLDSFQQSTSRNSESIIKTTLSSQPARNVFQRKSSSNRNVKTTMKYWNILKTTESAKSIGTNSAESYTHSDDGKNVTKPCNGESCANNETDSASVVTSIRPGDGNASTLGMTQNLKTKSFAKRITTVPNTGSSTVNISRTFPTVLAKITKKLLPPLNATYSSNLDDKIPLPRNNTTSPPMAISSESLLRQNSTTPLSVSRTVGSLRGNLTALRQSVTTSGAIGKIYLRRNETKPTAASSRYEGSLRQKSIILRQSTTAPSTASERNLRLDVTTTDQVAPSSKAVLLRSSATQTSSGIKTEVLQKKKATKTLGISAGSIHVTTPSNNVLKSVTRDLIVHTNMNRIESVTEKSYSAPCHGLSCGVGGVCIEHGSNGGRCLCPFRKRGSHCEKDNSFTHPKFSGNSYLLFNQPVAFAKDFYIMTEFRAKSQNGVLLYGTAAAGNSDSFFAVLLVDGFLQLRLRCGPGFMAISSPERVRPLHWHRATIRKFKNEITIQLNGALVTISIRPCLKTRLDTEGLYLGGLPHDLPQRKHVGLVNGFFGCIRKLVVNRKEFQLTMQKLTAFRGLDIADCTDGSCALNDCHGTCIPEGTNSSQCLCSAGLSGSMCTKDESITIPKFTGSGLLEFEGLASTAWSSIDIEIVLKIESMTGLVLFNGDRTDQKGDFISIVLKKGHVEFSYDCGTGPAVIRSISKLKMNQWHVIRASRKGKFGTLQVDDNAAVSGQSRGPFQMLKLRRPLFVGGIKFFSDVPSVVGSYSNFKGCIEKILINKKQLAWSKSRDGYAVENCDSHNCFQEECSNRGRCEFYKGAVWCHCYLGYSGDHCEIADGNITIPKFNGHSFLKFKDRRLFKNLANPTSDMSFAFKSQVKNGLLVWNGQRDFERRPFGDFLSLALEDGYLLCRYDFGDGENILNSTRKLIDNKWHEVRLTWFHGKVELYIDDIYSVQVAVRGIHTMFNTDGELYIGGAENIFATTKSIHFQGLDGCMRNLKIAGRSIDLIGDAESGHDVMQCT